MKDSTQRFSDRVSDYIKYRPSYPKDMIQILAHKTGISDEKTIADVGSGTGILTKQLLEIGCDVYAIEPNKAMRTASEDLLNTETGFFSVNATAENTTLPDNSVDGITVGQAFHWFDRLATKMEFRRILKPEGFIALIWNNWRGELSPFMAGYAKLLEEWGTDYQRVSRTSIDDAAVGQFYHPNKFEKYNFPNYQIFDFQGLKGRLLSSSYSPKADHPKHEPLIEGLTSLFEQYQVDGIVRFEYITTLYLG